MPQVQPPAVSSARILTEQAFDRAAGAPLIRGNAVRLLKDGAENYPAWFAALEAARRTIHIEVYILADDTIGRRFAEVLIRKARAGVKVRVVYDWLGAIAKAGRRYWRALRDGGVEVRCFNPLRLTSPLDVLRRNHRKSIVVDGEVAFVTGLCVADVWTGDRAQHVEPWRDTGIELRGPAVYDVGRAFADTWGETGAPLAADELPVEPPPAAGDVALRVVAGTSFTAATFRLDTLVAALARRRLWLADAYFAGTCHLRAGAARGGAGRRRRAASGAGSRNRRGSRAGALAGGLPAAARGRRARLRVERPDDARQDRGRRRPLGAHRLHQPQRRELDRQLGARRRGRGRPLRPADGGDVRGRPGRQHRDRARPPPAAAGRPRAAGGAACACARRRRGSSRARRAAAGAVRLGYTIGAAVAGRRTLGPAEAVLAGRTGVLLLILAAITLFWPFLTAIPFAVVAAWIGLSLVVKAWRLRA